MSRDVGTEVNKYKNNGQKHKYKEIDSSDYTRTVTSKQASDPKPVYFKALTAQLNKTIQAEKYLESACWDIVEQPILVDDKGLCSVEEREKPVIINGVKIQPGCMIFKDAYDGKRYKQKVTITNCRKVNVNIRICAPTSKAFKIKPMLIGRTLSPGLSIVRYVRYLYAKAYAIPQACMDIMIDNDCLRYELLVQICHTQVAVSPKLLDFGDIDVGLVSEVKKITVSNIGTKQAQFATDVGWNQLQLIVEPTKGTLQPGESQEITVEAFGSAEGHFSQEFWIKTEPLQRVHIQGCFIKPCLKVSYPFASKNLLILNFHKTFVGVPQQRNVVMLNHSSSSAVFCINGRIKEEKMPYMKAVEKDINFKQFQVVPLEGRLHKDQKFIMRVIFTPQNLINRPNYYICNTIVDVRNCRSIGHPYADGKCRTIETHNTQAAPLQDSISVASVNEVPGEMPQEIMVFDDMVTILLYGEVELPDISMSPDKFHLKNLKVYETHMEAVTIVNNSETLAVTLKYNKIPSIEFEPATIILPPRKPMEAVLKVRPTKMGEVTAKLTFEVFYFHNSNLHKIATTSLFVVYSGDYKEERKLSRKKPRSFLPGITPTNNNEVGFLVNDVRFNTKIEKPIMAIVDKELLVFNKDNDALIAFPNDRPRVLKPWRNTVPCKTIFTQLPRLVTRVDVDYDLTARETFLKNSKNTYYDNYIKSLNRTRKSKMPMNDFEDYDITDRKKILLEHVKNKELIKCYLKRNNGNDKQSLFVPLTPYQIQNTVVTPKFIQLGRLAANTHCADYFNVENKNDFPIHISIKALYTAIQIREQEFILERNSQKKIHFVYHSDSNGTHHIPMFIIMNFFHVLDVTVLATIVNNTVRAVTKDLYIIPSEKTAFLELRNPLNSSVGFKIETNFNLLDSFPCQGVIPAKRNMTITVTLNPEVGYTPVKEIAVISESGAKELIDVYFNPTKAPVILGSDCLTYKNIPLNTEVTQTLSIFNKSDQFVPLEVEVGNVDFNLDLTINPMKTLIVGKGTIALTFSIIVREVLEFTVPVNLVFQFDHPQQILITGNAIYPDVVFRPELIKINKIPSGSILATPFKIINNSEATNYMSFPMGNFPEFALKNKAGELITEDILYLPPKERKEVLLEFRPQEPVAYCISLPYIINGMLGPPELNRPETLQRESYFTVRKGQHKGQKLSILKILCAAGKMLLEFNSLELEFGSFERTQRDFTVTNVSAVCQEIFWKVSDIKLFKFTPISENTFLQDDEIQATIEPNDTCKVSIEFLPIDYGEFQYDIPIFVKDYSDKHPFNQIRLKGDNPTSQINPKTPVIYFTPTYAGSRQVIPFFLDLIAHKCDRKVEVTFDCPALEVALTSHTKVSELYTKLAYKIVFAPTEECTIDTEITFTCSCNTSNSVEVFACGDKALIINFMSEPNIVAESTYPFFPSPSDTSSYANTLRNTIPVIERWLYTQGYFYQYYYRIPDDMVSYRMEVEPKKATSTAKKKGQRHLPLVQLLINLIDSSILRYINHSNIQLPALQQRAIHNYTTYRRTILYLHSQSIRVPGLKPEHLLTYAEYKEYKNTYAEESSRKQEEFTQETFYNFSKQKWLDLFCHIYKVLVQQRIVNPSPTPAADQDTADFIKKDKEQFDEYVQMNIYRFSKLFIGDAKLLLWLEYHLNRQRNILWPNENFEGTQHLKDFSDVDDSVSLATVTAAYCPYLKDHLKDVYPLPKTIEQKIHNSCKVVQAWKNLKLSFDVHPNSIVIANKIKIIFIVTYLYDVLPYFYPTNAVTIEAPLSESVSYNLNVQNCGYVPIHYSAIFFGQNAEVFKLNSNSISIPGGKSRKLQLTYTAKKVLDASVILVLSGESGGQRYAKSMVVVVTGVPKTTSSVEIKLPVETYKTTRRKIQLKSPYAQKYRAKIYICFEEPKSYKDLHSVALLSANNIGREIDISTSECVFNEKGETTVSLTTCFLSQAPISFYLYLCDDFVGDFCVLLRVIPSLHKNKAIDLPVELHPHFNKACTCLKGFNVNCPKAFTVYIPSRNDNLWTATNTMIRRCFSENDYKLLHRFFGTPIIFRTLKFYLERFPEGFMIPSSIYDDSNTLTVTPSRSFSMSRTTVKIDDVTSNQTVPLVLHWQESDRPSNFLLELKGENLKEIRLYKLLFNEEEERTDNNISSAKLSKSSSFDK